MASKFLLLVEYEGTRYCGFQIQPNRPTIQGEIEKALGRLTGEFIRIRAASRTDAGVHAKGQVVGLSTGSRLTPRTFVKGLNYYLPEDIAIRAAARVGDDFQVRRWAESREYRYKIVNRSTPIPLERGYAHLVTKPLDVAAMGEACRALVGRHDCAAFASVGCANTVRTIYRAEVNRSRNLVTLDFMANSFLPHQVCNMVGALIWVGLGRASVESFREAVNSGRKGFLATTAPPHGLCLMKVNYPTELVQWEGAELEDL